MADSEALALLKDTIERHLRDMYPRVETERGDFVVREGDTPVRVAAAEWNGGQTLVRIWAVASAGMRAGDELLLLLACANATLPVGRFELHAEGPAVVLGHTLLGDFLQRRELEGAVRAVGATAARYSDAIEDLYGGQPARAPASSSLHMVRSVFALLGLVAAIGGAIWAYELESSVWLSAFVALMAMNLVARGAADLVTDPQKLRRAVYFVLQPAISTGVLVASYDAWERWWLAVLLGLIVGGAISQIVRALLLPKIHREETEDTARRISDELRPEAGHGGA
jgi:Putative bacterial sensory transduction regulator